MDDPRPTCPRCGAPAERLMYNSVLCSDCYYKALMALDEKAKAERLEK